MIVNPYQYTSLLSVVVVKNNGGFSASGDVYKGEKSERQLGICRDEAGTGKAIALPDGTSYTFSSIIYLPNPSNVNDLPKVGETVIVRDKFGNIRVDKMVRVVRSDEFHSRIWV